MIDMKGNIETACFNCAGGRDMIYASNREAEWILNTSDIRACYGDLFDKESGKSIILLSPMKDGMCIIVVKMIPNRFGDNITAYLHIPYGLDVTGKYLKGVVFDVISALEQNRKDTVSLCLSNIAKDEFDIISENETICDCVKESIAYRKVNSGEEKTGTTPLESVLENLYQDYYTKYKYVFLAVDDQHIANEDRHDDLTDCVLKNWRKEVDATAGEKASDVEKKLTEDKPQPDLTQNDEKAESEPTVYTSEWLKSHTDIHGWLTFFLIAIGAGGILSSIYPLATFNFDDYAGNYCLAAFDIVSGLLMLTVSAYTIYAFIRRKPDALFWAVVYVVMTVLSNIIGLVAGVTDDTGIDSTKNVIGRFIGGIIWLVYLFNSEQVQRIIPKAFRQISKLDYGLLAAIIIVPSLLYGVGYAQINNIVESRNADEAQLLSTILADDERTDGKVIFTIPYGSECERQEVDVEGTSVTIFTITDAANGIYGVVCSDYDSDKSQSNFNDYWNDGKDEDLALYDMTDVDRGTMTINGNDCLYRITKHDVNGVIVYWRYYLLFDDVTGKVFLASLYDGNKSTDYINELLESVRFK